MSFLDTAKNEFKLMQEERDKMERQIKLLNERLKKDQKRMATLARVISALEELNGQSAEEEGYANAA